MINLSYLKDKSLYRRPLLYLILFITVLLISVAFIFFYKESRDIKSGNLNQNEFRNLAVKIEPLDPNQPKTDSNQEDATTTPAEQQNDKGILSNESIKNKKVITENKEIIEPKNKKNIEKDNTKNKDIVEKKEPKTQTQPKLQPSEEMINLINQIREKNSLRPLKINPLLTQAAMTKSKDMAENNYFSHQSPNGKEDIDIITETGYNYKSIGSNIAQSADGTDSAAFVMWMENTGHRENILADFAVEIGYGKYGNYHTLIVAEPAEQNDL